MKTYPSKRLQQPQQPHTQIHTNQQKVNSRQIKVTSCGKNQHMVAFLRRSISPPKGLSHSLTHLVASGPASLGMWRSISTTSNAAPRTSGGWLRRCGDTEANPASEEEIICRNSSPLEANEILHPIFARIRPMTFL